MAEHNDHKFESERERLSRMIDRQEQIVEALIQKAQQMLLYPLAKTTHTESGDGKQVTTEVHPAKWSMVDAAKFYSQAVELLNRIDDLREHADRIERQEIADELPAWVPAYLAAWGGERQGRRMTVTQAAQLAGTTGSNVRNLRQRSEQFRRLEYVARHGDTEYMQSMVEAGLRGNALTIFGAFMRLVQAGNTQAVLKAMEWLQDKPLRIKMEDDDDLLSDDERARQIMVLLDAARARRDGGGTQE